LWKTKTFDVTPAKAGVQSEKAGFPLEFIPHTMRGWNDKYCFRNRNYLGACTPVLAFAGKHGDYAGTGDVWCFNGAND